MPTILIKDYTWRQTSEFVLLNIPLRGHPKKVEVFVIDNYLKVSFPPFILELFLWANVNEKESRCTITDREAILTLRKTNIDLAWPALEIQNVDNNFKRECRNQALENAQKLAAEAVKMKNEKRQHLQREAVREQIDINTATLNKIDSIRDTHRKEAMREFDDWRSKAEIPLLNDIEGEIQENRKAYKSPLKWFKDDAKGLKSQSTIENQLPNNGDPATNSVGTAKCVEKAADDKEIINIKATDKEDRDVEENLETLKVPKGKSEFSDDNDDSTSTEDSTETDGNLSASKDKKAATKLDEKKKKGRPGLAAVKAAIKGKLFRRNNIFEEPSKSIPLPRKRGTINVTFSERKFPTPARESSHLEEQEWLQKQAEARRKVGFDADDLRPEERDPQWLKDKGDEFFKVGNYLGAISAYSYGIKISDKMSTLYVNRSAAHYAQGNYHRCIDDCSKALELMEPKCEGNRESRARCHARRGAALCKLSAPQHGIPELEAALRLTPDNESIKRDVLTAKQYFDVKD